MMETMYSRNDPKEKWLTRKSPLPWGRGLMFKPAALGDGPASATLLATGNRAKHIERGPHGLGLLSRGMFRLAVLFQ